MLTILKWITLIILTTVLIGCASQDLRAPCPNFGAHCTKVPVNGWNSNV